MSEYESIILNYPITFGTNGDHRNSFRAADGYSLQLEGLVMRITGKVMERRVVVDVPWSAIKVCVPKLPETAKTARREAGA